MKTPPPQPDSGHWRWQDIDFSRIETAKVKYDELLFYMLTASSFVEIAADVYTRNLIEHYAGDPNVAVWLSGTWEKEEIQHGQALRAYVAHVWPEFDWGKAYAGFFAEYSAVCTLEELEPGKAREMAARCVVEMGTSTFYTMLNAYSQEPILKQLTRYIKQDEVAHYRNFRHFYRHFNTLEKNGRLRLITTLFKRFMEAEDEDGLISFKHVYTTLHPDTAFDPVQYRRFVNQSTRLIAKPHYPYKMAVRMLLNLLDLHQWIRNLLEPLLVLTARQLFFR